MVFKGNNDIAKDFGNLSKLDLEEFSFGKDGKISGYKTKIRRMGIIEETIIFDTVIKSKNENFKKMRTIVSYIDFDNLLIDHLDAK